MHTRYIGVYVSITDIKKRGTKAQNAGYPRRCVCHRRISCTGRAHAFNTFVLTPAAYLFWGDGIRINLQCVVQWLTY